MFKHLPPIKSFKQRGQVLVLYALLIPFLLMFVGVGLDLGWYYLNVSRLQNAADAAALAGARALADDFNSKAKSTTTETTTSGNTTTTTATTTYSCDKLVDKYPGDKPYEPTSTTEITAENKAVGDDIAEQYVIKNIGENLDTGNIIIDNWSKGGDSKVTPDYSLYENDDKFYYVVRLTESIEHLFMPGWFKPMEAPVVAVALISKSSSSKTFIEELTELFEKLKNENVIIGNWEIQDKYKDLTAGSDDFIIKPGEQIIDSSGHVVDRDGDGNPDINDTDKDIKVKLTRAGKFYVTFGSDYYTGAWNHFQDFYNRYRLGDLYRKQTVVIKDDVLFDEDENGTDIIDRKGNKGTITSYGAGAYGIASSVAATSASINNDNGSPGYNPKYSAGTPKTYQSGITEVANDKGVGLPFTWKRLDSINIDFRHEVKLELEGKWLYEDWDLELDDFTGVSLTGDSKKWETSGSTGSNKIYDDVIKRLRIHTSINFENPYEVRPDVDADDPDVLWARIESEPIINKPDITDSSNAANLSSIVSTQTLNSVNQIILNFNQSNYDSSKRYRPVIIFYDGPESYDNVFASYKAKPDIEEDPDNLSAVLHRKSKPIIVNLNAPYRGILYAPNSPVVVIGKDKSNFKGFIMAKEYMELKDDDDFISAEDYLREQNKELGEDELSELIYAHAYRYFNNANRQYEYTREVKADGTVQYRDLGGTKISTSVTKDEQAYRLKVYYEKDDTETDLTKKKRYYKVVGKTSSDTSTANTYETGSDGMKYIKVIEENGIDMYVNDYGEIRFKKSSPPTDCGEYDTFGRTNLFDGTVNYSVLSSSETNMLVSGK